MAKVINHEWQDVDIEQVLFVESIPSIQIHINPNDMVNSFIELEREDLIAMCKAFGVKGEEIE
jgi:hypothetical protein